MAATYSIRAPDGRTYQIEGPAGASQDQVQAQVLRQFPNAANEPSGGGRFAQGLRAANLSTQYRPDGTRRSTRERVPVPVTTRREEIQREARTRLPPVVRNISPDLRREAEQRVNDARIIQSPFLNALDAGVKRALFGVPERLGAAARYVTGVGASNYQDTLAQVRGETNQQLSGSTTGNVLGQIIGSGIGGGAAGRLVTAGAGRLASAASPVLSRAGNVLQSLTNLVPGQRLANAGRISLAGATGGAAQAEGEGSDVVEGATVGAVAAPAFHGGIQFVRQTGRLLRQATRPFSRSTSRAMREVVTEAPEAVTARHADLEAQTGAPVPVVAALRPRDFRAVTERVLRRSPEATEIAKTHTGQYVRGFMNRMLTHVNRAGREGNAQNTSIGELAQLRRDTADELMSPIRGREVDLTMLPLADLERRVTRQIGGRIQGLAPRINQALRDLRPDDLNAMGLDASDVTAARRLMTEWGLGTPVRATVQEMDSLRRALDAAGRSAQGSNPANAMAFRNASHVVRDFVSGEVPAYGQMVDTYAAQSRILEGFETAAAGRRVADIEDDLLRGNLRTPEGRVGMKAGELYRQREAVTGRTTGAIAAARDFASEGRLTRPPSLEPGAAQPGTVTENLGERAAAGLSRASQGETRVLGRMLDTEKVNVLARDEEGALSAEDIVYSAFLGNAMAATKARFIARLLSQIPHGINKRVANNLADMLFSQNPAQTTQAMRALQRVGLAERAVTSLMRNSLPANIAIGAAAGGRGAPGEDAPPDPNGEIPSVEDDLTAGAASAVGEAAVPSEEELIAANAENPDGGPTVEGNSPYAQQLQEIYDSEDPALLELISRVEGQESGGNQFDPDTGQPLESDAGAIGAMQVMPTTGPEAARLAGVRWDPHAYRQDGTYNKLIGIAYLSEQLRRYDGDVRLALIAYNAGPDRADNVARGGTWIPDETRDYLESILG